MKAGRLTGSGRSIYDSYTRLSITGEESECHMCYLNMLNVQKATDDVYTRTCTLQDKVSSAHTFFSSLKQVSGLYTPLQPSPHPVATSLGSKKSKNSNGENRGIAGALFQSTESGTSAEPLLFDPLDESLPNALSVVHHAPVISPENTVSTAPSRI